MKCKEKVTHYILIEPGNGLHPKHQQIRGIGVCEQHMEGVDGSFFGQDRKVVSKEEVDCMIVLAE